MNETVLIFIVTGLASIVGAIGGIGGGIIIKPTLEFITNEPIEVIAFLSGSTVLTMAVVSLLRRRKQIAAGFELRRGTQLALGSAAGGVLGKLLFDEVRRAAGAGAVGISQSVVLGLMAVFLIINVMNQARVKSRDVQSGAACAVIGGGLGLLGAFLGIGGGPLNLAALSYFLSMDNKRASVHSIYVVLFSQSASIAMTALRGAVPPVAPVLMIASVCGGVLGALVGSTIAQKMSNRALGVLYMAILLLVLALAVVNLSGYIG